MTGWYELASNTKGEFFFTLKAGNSEVVLTSEQYNSKAAAENGIKAVQTNCGAEASYERKDATDGRTYFTLKAANHQVIGTSQMYKSTSSRDAGIDAVKTNGRTKTIKEV